MEGVRFLYIVVLLFLIPFKNKWIICFIRDKMLIYIIDFFIKV